MASQQPSGPALVVRHTGQVFPLTQAPVTIGRHPDNVIVLSDPQVSRHHATISWQSGQFIVQDLGSANGTYIDEQRITGPQPLRDGTVLRMGSTYFDLQLPPAAGAPAGAATMMAATGPSGRSALPIVLALLLAGITVVGLAILALLILPALGGGKPSVIIQSPMEGAQIVAGHEITLQATADGARDITRLDLMVNDVLVSTATSPDPDGASSLTVSQPWTFGTAGPHTVSAVAYTSRERSSDREEVRVTVVDSAGQVTPTSTPAPGALADLLPTYMKVELETGGACDFSSTQLGVRVWVRNDGQADAGPFVVDVNGARQTVAGGLAAGQETTLWFSGYVNAGENTATVDPDNQIPESNEDNNVLSQMLPIPTLPPTCTPPPPGVPSDTPTPTFTPTATSTPTNTPTPTPTNTTFPPPTIEYFQANPATITAGDCSTLEWGLVSNATEVVIDHGVGGIGTPGSTVVCPAETTTYMMTATGPGGTSNASTTVTVQAALPDLTVESITFVPLPPLQNQDNEVRILIRNIGSGPAGPFEWEWQPGTAVPYQANVPAGLNAGGSIEVSLTWHPGSSYSDLPTVARVDPDNLVPESDETNNELQVNVEVIAPTPTTVILTSQAALDGFRSNNGGGNNGIEIRVGNGPFVGSPTYEMVTRGFMSYDISGIPTGATIQSIELRFYQVQIEGDPYGKLGNLMLKHVDYGGSLNDAAFDTPELASGILAPHTSPGQWYTITSNTIAAWIEDDLAHGRSRTQMRLQFSSEEDTDGLSDKASFESGDNYFGTGNLPQLTITYVP